MVYVQDQIKVENKYTLRNCFKSIEKITGEKLKGHELFNKPKQVEK